MKTIVSIGVVMLLAATVVLGIIFWPKSKPQVPTSPVPALTSVTEQPPSSPPPDPSPLPLAKTVSITVEGTNFAFSPKQVKVNRGDTVVLSFKSVEGFHDLVIDEFEVATNQVGADEEEEVEFVANKTGTFEYYCSVGKHRTMGMVGKLIVE